MPKVNISDIESVDPKDLQKQRLATLLNGFNTFEEVLNGASGKIALSGSKPYTIVDGRHRIYLARQQNYRVVDVDFV